MLEVLEAIPGGLPTLFKITVKVEIQTCYSVPMLQTASTMESHGSFLVAFDRCKFHMARN